MKLFNVQFIKPVVVGGIPRENVASTEGYVEELPDQFPRLVIRINGKPPRGTTWFNLAGWDHVESAPAKGKGK